MPAGAKRLAWAALVGCAALAAASLAKAQGFAPPPRMATVGLPVPQFSPTGELVVRPNVDTGRLPVPATTGHYADPFAAQAAMVPLAAEQPAGQAALASHTGTDSGLLLVPPGSVGGPESLPPPHGYGAEPAPLGGILGDFFSNEPDIWLAGEPLVPWENISALWSERQISPTGEAGLGRERVATAPFEIDISQPMGNFRFRTDAVYNLTKPDRSEYFWAMPGRGPVVEESVDYQDVRFLMETGTPSFSLGTEVPIRMLNPEINGNTAGVGDIQLVQKAVLLSGSRWQMTQLTRTTFNNGNARKGLGTGHVSIEPGMLFRYQYSELTYLHSELKLTFPIAGDPAYSGQALKWGVGVSTVYYETDTMALIPTLEFTNIWLLDGQYTPFPAGVPTDVDGDGIFNLAPGLRIACDTGGDLGVVELGFSSVMAIGSNGWYDALLRMDIRFVF